MKFPFSKKPSHKSITARLLQIEEQPTWNWSAYFEEISQYMQTKPSLENLEKFLSLYEQHKKEGKIPPAAIEKYDELYKKCTADATQKKGRREFLATGAKVAGVVALASMAPKLVFAADKTQQLTIYLIEENDHDTEDKEIAVIDSLVKSGCKLIGIEGWAGKEADQARGRMVLNGSIKTIKKLLPRDDIILIGLEEPRLQTLAFEIKIVQAYKRYLSQKTKVIGLTEEQEDAFLSQLPKLYEATMQKDMRKYRDAYLPLVRNHKISDQRNFQDLIQYANTVANLFFHSRGFIPDNTSFHQEAKTICARYPEYMSMNEAEFQSKVYKPHILEARNRYAVSKILQAMQQYNVTVAAIFYGNAHTKQIEEILKENKIKVERISLT